MLPSEKVNTSELPSSTPIYLHIRSANSFPELPANIFILLPSSIFFNPPIFSLVYYHLQKLESYFFYAIIVIKCRSFGSLRFLYDHFHPSLQKVFEFLSVINGTNQTGFPIMHRHGGPHPYIQSCRRRFFRVHYIGPGNRQNPYICFYLFHFRYPVGIAGEIYSSPLNRKNKANPPVGPGMERFILVIGRHGFNLQPFHLDFIARLDNNNFPFDFGCAIFCGNHYGFGFLYLFYIFRRKMVEMIMRYQNHIGLFVFFNHVWIQVHDCFSTDFKTGMSQPVQKIHHYAIPPPFKLLVSKFPAASKRLLL